MTRSASDSLPRIWRFGDNVDTDAMAPAVQMRHSIDVLARHCLASLRPEFPGAVRPGDILVGGSNFGMGSSREQAPQALRQLGISVLVAPSFAGLFYRNAINLGLPALVCEHTTALDDGARVAAIDLEHATLQLAGGACVRCEPLPPFLLAILRAGGLMAQLKARFQAHRDMGAA